MRATLFSAVRQDLELLLASRELPSWRTVGRAAGGFAVLLLALLPWL